VDEKNRLKAERAWRDLTFKLVPTGSGFHNVLSFLYLLPQAQAPRKSRIMFVIPVKAGI